MEKIALTMAISPVVSAFPILGTTNLLSIIVGSALRLNLPFLLLFKTIFYPLHIGLILVFIRIGDTYEVRPVELGRRDGTQVEVLSGLNPGDLVVVEQSYLVKADIEKSGASHDH